MIDPARFIDALYSHLPPGFIEIRIIEDKKGGRVIERHWYESAQALSLALDGLNALAESKGAGIFLGVLPRKSIGLGKTEDVLPGFGVWGDADFKHYPGGETECRAVIAHCPVQPSALIRSGHGLHPYLLLPEPAPPPILVELSARLAQAIRGDHVADAARLLRLPGTINYKDPSAPVPVEIEFFDPVRRYTIADLTAAFPPLSPTLGMVTPIDDATIPIGPSLSQRVIRMLDRHPKIHALFNGHGKPAIDSMGRRLDTTSSGYDFSLLLELIRAGVTDEQELATALHHRPDDAARTKGRAYITHTVRMALQTAATMSPPSQAAPPDVLSDLAVERVRLFNSDPPLCELTIDGHAVVMTAKEILSLARVRERLFSALHRVPRLPKAADWNEQVNALMERAEIIQQPPEASPTGLLKEEILGLIEELATGETAADLDRDRAVLHDGQKAFKTRTVLRRLREQFADLDSPTLCCQLRSMSFDSKSIRIGDQVVRAWIRVAQPNGEPTQGGEA